MSLPMRVSDSQPVLLLIHGSWFGSWSWDLLRHVLAVRGWRTQTVDLPSVGDRDEPRRDLFDDAEVVRQRIKDIGGPVVVVGHSYGGAVASQAAADLANVQHLVYVSAFQLDVGESVLSVLSNPLPWLKISDDVLTVHNPRKVFLDDVRPELAVLATDRLRPSSTITAKQKLTAAAWHTIPSTYIITDNDKAGPVSNQEFLAARATYVRRIPSGHLPQLSMPSALADLLVEAAANVKGDSS